MTDSLQSVAELLERAGVPYAVIGGHAVNVWLEPRFTADIDVTVVASTERLEALIEVLKEHGFRVERQYGAELPSGPDFTRVINGDGTIVLELQTAKTALQRDLVARAAVHRGVRVATVEDLIVLKLIASRSKDRIDLEGLARLSNIDWAYIEQRCAEWDILERMRLLRGL